MIVAQMDSSHYLLLMHLTYLPQKNPKSTYLALTAEEGKRGTREVITIRVIIIYIKYVPMMILT